MNKRGIVVHRGIKYNVRSQDSYNCNYNVYIAGGAGSGKNILIQEMILATFSVEGKVVVFDYGKNFWHLCQVLDGYYIEFNPSNPVLINPFTSVPTGSDRRSANLIVIEMTDFENLGVDVASILEELGHAS